MRAVDALVRRFTRLVASGTNAPPFNLQANAVRQTSFRSAESFAAAFDQRQIKLAPIAAVTVESCKSQVLRNKVPKNHLSESTYATKIGFLIRSG